MKEKVKEFFVSNWTLSEKCLLVADVLLFGILVGWLSSPLKNGFSFCSHNTCGNNNSGSGRKDRKKGKEEEEK